VIKRDKALACPSAFKKEAEASYNVAVGSTGVVVSIRHMFCSCKNKCECDVGKKRTGYQALFR